MISRNTPAIIPEDDLSHDTWNQRMADEIQRLYDCRSQYVQALMCREEWAVIFNEMVQMHICQLESYLQCWPGELGVRYWLEQSQHLL